MHIDSVEQYERADIIIVSGPALLPETQSENNAVIIAEAMKQQLKLNVQLSDSSAAHRLGLKNQQNSRPVIVKLINRAYKYEIKGPCLKIKPDLYVNESLTHELLQIFKDILAIKKQHRNKFKQFYTNDGKIVVKLINSTIRHEMIDKTSLNNFLEKYLAMKDTFLQIASYNYIH